jgi:hypothetical protein
MQNYPVRTTHRKGLEVANLGRVLSAHFEGVQVSGDRATGTFGAISRITVGANGRDLAVEVTMNPKVPADVAAETIQRYNRFLEEATGYSSKERARRLRKSASAPGA